MNLLGSYAWMKEYLKTDLSPEEFAREISLRSASVEEIIELEALYGHMVIGVVDAIEPHPGADRLKLAKTNVGDKVLTIVCGGKNLREGQKVVVALPGAKVRWHGEGDLITLEPATIRGVASEGMICAPEEIGFEKAPCEEHGIWDITDICESPAGTSVIEAFGLKDTLFDIEVTTNRSDSMSMIGLAREAGACSLGEFTWKPSALPEKTSERLPLSVRVEAPALAPRYIAVALDNIKVGPSPLWLQMRLLLSGHRPINNVVDITNYILHEYGQPLHAFDYDKVPNGSIVVRTAQSGEKIKALDGNEYELSETQLVIADEKQPIAVAGVMGGETSGTYEHTTRIVIEAATFDGASVRRTARDLNLYSDAQSMYEKGLSTESLTPALARALELLQEIAGGEVASEIIDIRAEAYQPKVFKLDPARVSQILGVEVPEAEQVAILEKLGFICKKEKEVYAVTAPYWRDRDIEDDVDLIEEIARIFGYHNIPSHLPEGRLPARTHDAHLFWEEEWKRLLVSFGYTEFFGNSLVSAQDLERVGVDPESAVRLHNPLTMDLTHMRTTLLPSLLKGIELNQAHHREGKVFEIARAYTRREKDLPLETTDVLIAQFGYTDALRAFREIKGTFDELMKRGGAVAHMERIEDHELLHATRAARILMGGKEMGIIGELRSEIADRFGVDVPVMVLIVHTEEIMPQLQVTRTYRAEPVFPPVLRDMSLLVDAKVTYEAVAESLRAVDGRVREVTFKEQYAGKGIPEGKKSITLGLILRDEEKTIEGTEVEEMMNRAAESLQKAIGAEVR